MVTTIIEVPPVQPELDVQGSSLGLTDGFRPDGIDGGLCDGSTPLQRRPEQALQGAAFRR